MLLKVKYTCGVYPLFCKYSVIFGIKTVGVDDDVKSYVSGPPQLFLSFHICSIPLGFSFPRKLKSGGFSKICNSRSNYVGSAGGF